MLLSSAVPGPEATNAVIGLSEAVSRSDHRHPRLTSTTTQNLDVAGNATVMFTKVFPTKPGIACTANKITDNLPVTFEVSSWVMGGAGGVEYTGCVIHGSKAQTLPAVIGLLTVLLGFNIFQGNAASVEFSCIAVQASN